MLLLWGGKGDFRRILGGFCAHPQIFCGFLPGWRTCSPPSSRTSSSWKGNRVILQDKFPKPTDGGVSDETGSRTRGEKIKKNRFLLSKLSEYLLTSCSLGNQNKARVLCGLILRSLSSFVPSSNRPRGQKNPFNF